MSTTKPIATALVVDPNRYARQLLADLLREFGIGEVIYATDSDHARQAVLDHHPNVVFIEDNLEPERGVDVIKSIRQAHASYRVTPIVLIASSQKREDIFAARDAGATEIIVKPITPQVVLSRLKAVMLSKRPFVESALFAGPCRRRNKRAAAYEGPKRRLLDPEEQVDAKQEEALGLLDGTLDTLTDITRDLDPSDRMALRTLLEQLMTVKSHAKSAKDQLSGRAGQSLERYIRSVGASGALDTDVVHIHVTALHRLRALRSESVQLRDAVVEGLEKLVRERVIASQGDEEDRSGAAA